MTTTTQEIVEALVGQLEATRTRLVEARAGLHEIEREELGLTRALRALAPEHELVAPPQKAPPPKKRPASRVSDEIVESAFTYVDEALVPVTVKDVASRLSISTTAAASALARLRADGRIRLAGKQQAPGSPSLYALMNGAGHE